MTDEVVFQEVRLEVTAGWVSVSTGISLYPDDGRDAEILLKVADVAMYMAKKKRNNYQYYREYQLI